MSEAAVGHSRRPLLAASAVVLAAAAAFVIVLIARSGHQKPVSQTAFGFGTLYENRRGESYANEIIIARQTSLEIKYEPLSSEPGKQSAQCTPSPPPPTTHRLICSFINEIIELYPHYKATRTYYWKAIVAVDTHTGTLTAHISLPVVTGPIVTP
jgi:hypothetical protein